jgi:hypothetical protein
MKEFIICLILAFLGMGFGIAVGIFIIPILLNELFKLLSKEVIK